MRRYAFQIADVFSERAFGGNQLAVFPDADGLTDRDMQSLTREFNFAESTFVLPPAKPGSTALVRIFTPRRELDFAGHPSVGTAAVLAALGRIPLTDGHGTAILEERVGPVRVDVETRAGGAFGRLTLDTAVESPAEKPDAVAVAGALSLHPSAIVETWFASVGLRFCFVQLRDSVTVDRAVLDRTAWSKSLAAAWSPNLFFFSGNLASGSHLYARMFAPALGIDEDPATGSACATLAGILAGRLPDRDGTFGWRVNQGVALGRPSVLEIGATKELGAVRGVQVAGFTVIVGDGQMSVPT